MTADNIPIENDGFVKAIKQINPGLYSIYIYMKGRRYCKCLDHNKQLIYIIYPEMTFHKFCILYLPFILNIILQRMF